ncbi:MAG TPA: nucleoside-diphosphate sugar epimerase, partial [bacterium]|nr:nucleoside-diphosphate sugar epimerase [bacterium]
APGITRQFRKNDTRHCTADITKIRETLGFQPRVSLREGLAEVVAWSRTIQPEDRFEQAALELAKHGLT